MLYLKKVEMYGFKSFADKVELKFDQPITAIVGPNGCGKSNISDAIRWVLGEQSTKNLRGKVMQDLIFNGTDSRKSMSYCEVSLFMDNTTRIFPLPMDEVIISRKLYRNNESEYLLNRNVVRLMDIKELLRGVGLGKEGYSIVGQGRMDAILNAKPEDRRAIFEEAMGISTFRAKKVETERKLEKTRLNTENLMIIIEELKRRLPELKRQSTNARKYLDLYEQLKHHEINAYIYSYDNASQQKSDCRAKLEGLREEYAHKEILYAEVNEQYDEVFHKRNNIDTEIAALRDKQVNLAVEVERNSGEKNLVRERINSLKREVENAEQQIVEANTEIDKLVDANDQLKNTIARRIDERDQLQNEILQTTDKYNAIARRVDGIQQDLNNLRQKLEEVLAQIASLTSSETGFEAEVKTLSERLVEIAEKEQELSQRLQENAGEEGDLLGKYDELRKLKEELEKQAQQLKQQVKELEFNQFNLNTELQRKQQAYSSEKGGIDMLKEFVASYRGYNSCIQNLMQDAKHDSQLNSHICGVVANLIKVESKLRVAIETALGGRLQNIVTKNEEDVKYLINYLKINDYGKATFLPVSSMKPHGIDRADVLKEKGVLGIACELISYDKYYSNVFESLLGGIVIVDTFDNAVALSKKYHYVHRMVTLTGERINNDGSLEGGSSKKQSTSLLSQETQIEERTEKLAQLQRELQTVENQKRQLDKQLDECRQTQNALLARINAVNVDIATCREKIETSNTLSGADKKNILGLSNDKEKIGDRLDDLQRKIAKVNAQIEELKATEEKLREKIARTNETYNAEMVAKDGGQQSLTERKYRLAVLASNIDNLNREMQSNDKQVLSLRETIELKQNYISQVGASIDILYEKLNESTTDSALQGEMSALLDEIKSTDKLKLDIEMQFQTLTDQRMQLSNELQALCGSIEHQSYVLNKIDDDLMQLQDRVFQEYGVTYSAAMQYKAEEYDFEGGKNIISELRQSLQRLGSVNVNAIEELNETQERYDDYMRQIDDLKAAEDDLKTALKDLTADIEVRFEEGMSQINDNFKMVFRELFNGGFARLTVEKDPNKASLDYGVEIEAQPPGKKLQNISLLSGGERTMTSVAILFSILKYNPMPFCVLDEIEAPLDDANAERVSKFLRKFSSSTQFVVITHKKPTMENSDVLYGVTMEEKGVSKIVSVKLTEAIKQAM